MRRKGKVKSDGWGMEGAERIVRESEVDRLTEELKRRIWKVTRRVQQRDRVAH
jgi:hypothetical protein